MKLGRRPNADPVSAVLSILSRGSATSDEINLNMAVF